MKINCPSKDSEGRSCQVTKAQASVKVRGKKTNAKVSFPEQINPGKSARVTVTVTSAPVDLILRSAAIASNRSSEVW